MRAVSGPEHRTNMATRLNPLTLLLCAVLVACDAADNEPSERSDSSGRDTSAAAAADTTPASTPDVETWLANRYGPESGVVEYEVINGGERTSETVYFEDHGLREARYRQLGSGTGALQHITIVDSGDVAVLGPGDRKALRYRWKADPNTALPNFLNMTPEMRSMFSVEELADRRVLERQCGGYRLHAGGTQSDVWVWEGIMLYGELQAVPEKGIQPMIVRAISLETDVPVPDGKFRIANGSR